MQTFKKEERLHHKKLIEELSKCGRSFLIYPFKVIWMEKDINAKYPAQVLFTVSKKKQRKAVQRNKTKRILKEAYRKNKEAYFYEFLRNNNTQCVAMFIFLSEETPKYNHIETKIISVLKRLKKEIENKQNTHKTNVI